MNKTIFNPKTIVPGIRGEEFKNFIHSILKLGGLRQEMIEKICDNDGMEIFTMAFTHPTANKENNYEYLEFLGDSIVNAAIVWYLNKRFPKIRGATGVKVMSRLKILLVSKKSFSDFAKKMDMWKFVSANEVIKNTQMKKTLEDVFEALFGAITYLMDSKIREGTGYSMVSNIIGKLFDDIEISLKYNDLFDAKTRLKELFDFHRFLGTFKTEVSKEGDFFVVKIVIHAQNGKVEQIGQGKAMLKIDAEQWASKAALYHLNQQNIYKPIPEEYKNLE